MIQTDKSFPYTREELLAQLKKMDQEKENDRKTYKILINQELPIVAEALINASSGLSRVKAFVYNKFKDILALKEDIYKVKDNQRSHTFSDENFSISIGYRITDGWDDTASAGLAKVNEFIQSLAKDENSSKLVNTVNRLLKRDANNNLKANRVIELRALAKDYNDEGFTDGVDIILQSYKPIRSRWFIDAFVIENGIKKNIPLSISSADFPAGFDLSFLENIRK